MDKCEDAKTNAGHPFGPPRIDASEAYCGAAFAPEAPAGAVARCGTSTPFVSPTPHLS